MLIGDAKNWREHKPWIIGCLAVALVLGLWFVGTAWLQDWTWPSGSSLVGFICGVLGGLLITFEFLLWPRKRLVVFTWKARVFRLGRAVTWMRAHIWLGLLTGPLILYHSGLRFGGLLTTTLVVLFSVIIVSGIIGLVLQQYLPKLMWETVPAETIYSQIDLVGRQLSNDAERLVLAACGTLPGEAPPISKDEPVSETLGTHITVGAVRTVGKLKGKVVAVRVPRAPIPGAEPLRVFYQKQLGPFLEGRGRSNDPLGIASRASEVFENLRIKLDPAAHEVVEDLEGLCAQRRELELQRRIHFWLHSWLCVHVPLSAALMVLMIAHIVMALRFW